MKTKQDFRIARSHGPDLAFEGCRIGQATTRTDYGPSSYRWTEIRVYQTALGQYVVETVGRSLHDGENDIREAKVADTAQDLYDALLLPHRDHPNRRFLSRPAKQALEQAAIFAPEISEVLVERA